MQRSLRELSWIYPWKLDWISILTLCWDFKELEFITFYYNETSSDDFDEEIATAIQNIRIKWDTINSVEVQLNPDLYEAWVLE